MLISTPITFIYSFTNKKTTYVLVRVEITRSEKDVSDQMRLEFTVATSAAKVIDFPLNKEINIKLQ